MCYRNLWLPVVIQEPKTRNNALDVVCCIETIIPAAHAAATNKVFLALVSRPCAKFPVNYNINYIK